MKTRAEIAAELRGCILCGRNPVVLICMIVPDDAATLTAALKLRDAPLPDNQLPTVGYGLCLAHSQRLERSAALAHAKVLAAANEVTVQ